MSNFFDFFSCTAFPDLQYNDMFYPQDFDKFEYMSTGEGDTRVINALFHICHEIC